MPNVTETSDLDTAGFDHTFSINSRGLFICLREEIKAMKQQGLTELAEDALERPASRGSIVNVASIAGVSSIYGTIAYTASKHAVVGMTKTAGARYSKYISE